VKTFPTPRSPSSPVSSPLSHQGISSPPFNGLIALSRNEDCTQTTGPPKEVIFNQSKNEHQSQDASAGGRTQISASYKTYPIRVDHLCLTLFAAFYLSTTDTSNNGDAVF
jgi:hypothetical protein